MNTLLSPALRPIFISLLFSITGMVSAQTDYVVPTTEYGHPDMQGVWNFASHTPVQRAVQYGNREHFTTEENEENRLQSISAFEARAESHFDGVGGYNSFWYERATIGYDLRTSLITYPLNGRIPDLVEGVHMQIGTLSGDIPSQRPVRFVVGGISKDGPEDRGLSERCIIGFNAGPPFMPSSYNNNVQIIQHRDHVVIMTEMVHDARIVALGAAPQLNDNIRLWSGNSRGYWDGDTLVVETKNFNGIKNRHADVILNGSLENGLSHNLNLCFPGLDSESLIMKMKGIACSAGSACSSANLEPSHVIKALGINNELALSAIRFSVGRFNTIEEIDSAIIEINSVVNRIKSSKQKRWRTNF